MELRLDKAGKRGVLALKGALTVQCAKEARSLLVSAMEGLEDVSLDLSGLTELDLCGLQLLCSTRHTVSQRKMHLNHVGSIPAVFLQAVAEVGGCVHPVCAGAGYELCPWKRKPA